MKVAMGMCAKALVVACFQVMVTGCATINEPAITYGDAGHPHSDTAIFAIKSVGESVSGANNMLGSVLEVDGHSMRTFSASWEYPVWVRVLPGRHEFKIIYSKYPEFATKTVVVPDAQPRHVYVEMIHDYGRTYRMELKDLGENSNFTERLPWGTATKSGDFQATF